MTVGAILHQMPSHVLPIEAGVVALLFNSCNPLRNPPGLDAMFEMNP